MNTIRLRGCKMGFTVGFQPTAAYQAVASNRGPETRGLENDRRKAMEKAFETFTIAGVKFLAIDAGLGYVSIIDDAGLGYVSIIDEEGNFYGSWMDTDTFKKLLKAGKSPVTVIGKVCRINFYAN